MKRISSKSFKRIICFIVAAPMIMNSTCQILLGLFCFWPGLRTTLHKMNQISICRLIFLIIDPLQTISWSKSLPYLCQIKLLWCFLVFLRWTEDLVVIGGLIRVSDYVSFIPHDIIAVEREPRYFITVCSKSENGALPRHVGKERSFFCSHRGCQQLQTQCSKSSSPLRPIPTPFYPG